MVDEDSHSTHSTDDLSALGEEGHSTILLVRTFFSVLIEDRKLVASLVTPKNFTKMLRNPLSSSDRWVS